MTQFTTVRLNKSVVEALKKLKKYPRQSYSEVIWFLIECAEKTADKNHCDEFLCKVQQAKMKELWDNKEDEAWGNSVGVMA